MCVCVCVCVFMLFFIIIIRNPYIAPNPTRLAQSSSQSKTRMDIRISCNKTACVLQDTPTSTAKMNTVVYSDGVRTGVKVVSD